ncbi:DUF7065 domain-containing protein [Nocardia cyriacigeorgica]|uniref:DUF7065 domain-containing protein n=1 Tax=Nocardia cyriacigeorgica TaxID=135487 RepID=UPI002457401D|nr:hypothetical protein [Nocardia cyriacigeorgica]
MNSSASGFSQIDDFLHDPSDDFYHTETYWFSFFVPERRVGAWIYLGIRQNAGTTGGGLYLWDHTATLPWDLPFYEQFAAVKLPTLTGATLSCATGATITVIEPAKVYRVQYTDRDRVAVDVTFCGLEAPVPLRRGAPPFPAASHYDQSGHVTGSLVLDGEQIDVDCYAMRDRSWGPRRERGTPRIGYTWLADADSTLMTFSSPTETSDDVHAGYLRRDARTARVGRGHRTTRRDPHNAWIDGIDLAVVDETGREFTATGKALSRFILPRATHVCVNTFLEFDVDGRTVFGEDQDVWPITAFRRARR